jgi:hypothetical protein
MKTNKAYSPRRFGTRSPDERGLDANQARRPNTATVSALCLVDRVGAAFSELTCATG